MQFPRQLISYVELLASKQLQHAAKKPNNIHYIITHLDIGAIFWFPVHIGFLFQYLKLEAQVVDGDGVSASKVLQNTSEEGLGEVEPRHPEHVGRNPVLDPVLEKLEPVCVRGGREADGGREGDGGLVVMVGWWEADSGWVGGKESQ